MPEDLLLADGGRAVPLSDGLSIGRAADAGLRLDDTSVSRRHAVIRYDAGRWVIEDLGSRNGTRVNQAPVPPFTPCPLRDGDRLLVGRTALAVRLGGAADTTETTGLPVDQLTPALSPYQLRVIELLAQPWRLGSEPASNAEIAARLGTPAATDAVKAALRRVYAKLGIAGLPTHTKRRELCRIASRNGWI